MRKHITPRELAEAIGVSESSLKRWTDSGRLRAARTAGGHRRIHLSEAVRFIRESGVIVVRPDLLGIPELDHLMVPGTVARDDVDDRLHDFLVAGREREARGLVLSLFLGGRSVASICDGPIRSSMQRIGELWKQGDHGIYIEHRAVDICVQAIDQIRQMLDAPVGAPVAVGGAGPGDPTVLASLFASAVLLERGFEVHNIGANVPISALRLAALDRQASLVFMSFTHDTDPGLLTDQVQALADELGAGRTWLVLGGRALGAMPSIRGDLVRTIDSMEGLSAFVGAAFPGIAAPTRAS